MAQDFELRTVEASEVVVASLVLEARLHEAIGAGVGEGVDEDGIDDAEDGARGCDAEGEREDRSDRKARALTELASGVAKVGAKRIHRSTPESRAIHLQLLTRHA